MLLKLMKSCNIPGSRHAPSEWADWSASDARHSSIPPNPWEVYKDSGWEGYAHWLGKPVSPRQPAAPTLLSNQDSDVAATTLVSNQASDYTTRASVSNSDPGEATRPSANNSDRANDYTTRAAGHDTATSTSDFSYAHITTSYPTMISSFAGAVDLAQAGSGNGGAAPQQGPWVQQAGGVLGAVDEMDGVESVPGSARATVDQATHAPTGGGVATTVLHRSGATATVSHIGDEPDDGGGCARLPADGVAIANSGDGVIGGAQAAAAARCYQDITVRYPSTVSMFGVCAFPTEAAPRSAVPSSPPRQADGAAAANAAQQKNPLANAAQQPRLHAHATRAAQQVRPLANAALQVRPLADAALQVRPLADAAQQVRPLASAAQQVRPLANAAQQVRPLANAAQQVRPLANAAQQQDHAGYPTVPLHDTYLPFDAALAYVRDQGLQGYTSPTSQHRPPSLKIVPNLFIYFILFLRRVFHAAHCCGNSRYWWKTRLKSRVCTGLTTLHGMILRVMISSFQVQRVVLMEPGRRPAQQHPAQARDHLCGFWLARVWALAGRWADVLGV